MKKTFLFLLRKSATECNFFYSFIAFGRPFTFSTLMHVSQSSTQWIQWYVHAILIGFHHHCWKSAFFSIEFCSTFTFCIIVEPHVYMPKAWLPKRIETQMLTSFIWRVFQAKNHVFIKLHHLLKSVFSFPFSIYPHAIPLLLLLLQNSSSSNAIEFNK